MSIPVAEKDPEDIEEDSDFIEDNDASGERERGGGGRGEQNVFHRPNMSIAHTLSLTH